MNKYTLVLEPKPNSFEPIFIFNDLKELDDYTKKYNEDELIQFLLDNYYIYNKAKLSIIFNNNGLRKLNEGVLYKKDDYDFNDYIIEFMKKNKSNNNIINELYQIIISRKTSDNYTKELFHLLNILKKECNNEYELNLEKIKDICYFDKRLIYLNIKNNLEIKLNEEIKLKRINTNIS